MSTITELPENLHDVGTADLKHALVGRRARLDELSRDSGAPTAAKVAEMRKLNDELERLHEGVGDCSTKHPGHPVPPGQSSSRTGDRSKFGRVDGLGAEFIKAAGGLKVFDSTTGGGSMASSFFDPRIREMPQRKLLIRSLIPTTRVNGDRVEYVRQGTYTNNAAAVAAGGLKPTTVITSARETALVQVIAHISEALDRSLLNDFASLSSFVDNGLRLGVLLEEERQILLGSGTPPALRGILNTTGIQTQAKGTDPTPDAIAKAITKVRVVFGEPTAIVIHPNDWQEIALLRTADGLYIWGSPSDEAELSIWGLRVVVTPVITEGTALVGAFGTAAEVFEREGARVTFSESGLGNAAGEEMFSRNQIRFRGESRIGLAVIRPDNFCSVTGI